ncbi:MAG: hypothetical protein GX495_10270 [Chloroflexi bacterium]|nr:hypothetical protein [Chloroflexota bacterium]
MSDLIYESVERLEPALQRVRRTGLVAGLLASALLAAGYFISGPQPFFQAYLTAFLWILGLALGCLGVGLLHYLVGGRWGIALRRVLEAGYKTIWLVALLFIPIIFGLPFLYRWANPAEMSTDILQHKAAYLNTPFFLLRALVYFLIWIGLAWVAGRWAQRAEYNVESPVRRTFQRLSALGFLAYTLTMTFASVDWIMSLEVEWLSSVFGLLVITGQLLGGFALGLAVLPYLARERPLTEMMTPLVFRDLGAFLLSGVIFWAYIAYSQFVIIWSGNIPREVLWYLSRVTGGWLVVQLIVIVVQFVLPFLILLPLSTKRSPRILAFLAILILLMRLFETFWTVAPAFHPARFSIDWMDLVAPVALGGLWAAAFVWHLSRTPQAALIRRRPAELNRGEKQAGY